MKTLLRSKMSLLRAASKLFLRFGVVAALIVLAGCMTPVGVQKLSPRQAYLNLHRNALNSGQYSEDALVVLRRYNLEESFKQDPSGTLKKLNDIACTDERRDVLYTLSELNYANAERLSRSVRRGEQQQARDYYFTSAIYAYLYLFGANREIPSNPFD